MPLVVGDSLSLRPFPPPLPRWQLRLRPARLAGLGSSVLGFVDSRAAGSPDLKHRARQSPTPPNTPIVSEMEAIVCICRTGHLGRVLACSSVPKEHNLARRARLSVSPRVLSCYHLPYDAFVANAYRLPLFGCDSMQFKCVDSHGSSIFSTDRWHKITKHGAVNNATKHFFASMRPAECRCRDTNTCIIHQEREQRKREKKKRATIGQNRHGGIFLSLSLSLSLCNWLSREIIRAIRGRMIYDKIRLRGI